MSSAIAMYDKTTPPVFFEGDEVEFVFHVLLDAEVELMLCVVQPD